MSKSYQAHSRHGGTGGIQNILNQNKTQIWWRTSEKDFLLKQQGTIISYCQMKLIIVLGG